MANFQKVKIKDIGRVVTGKTPPTERGEFFGGEFPFITPSDIPNYKVRRSSAVERTLSDIWKNKAKNYLLPQNAICYVCIGSTVGKSCLTSQPSFSNQQINALICDPIKVDSNYIFYLLKNKTDEIKQIADSSGVGKGIINKTSFENLYIEIPDLPTQTHIASILSAYDNLIENNEKRIKVLEEMAQRLYEEWFVKFKFPGHEKVKMVDSHSEYRLIPEGWEVKKLGNIAELIMGQSPKSSHYNFEKRGLPFHQGVADFGYKYPVDRVYSTAGNKYAENGDLLFSVRAPVGRMNIANKKIILGRGLSAIRHKKGRQSLLYLMFDNKFTEKDMIGNGAIYKSVNKMELENLQFIVSPDDISEHFEHIISRYLHDMEKITAINIILSKTRDLLIPQLVTGKRGLK